MEKRVSEMAARATADAMKWFQRLLHRHRWEDWYVFDSCISVTIPTGERRVTGQAVMMCCACGATQRRALKTWREARIARRLLPYARSP